MMTKSTPKRSLSLGSRYRRLLAFAVLLPALLSGVATARAHQAPEHWEEGGSGGVLVSLTQLTSAHALPTTATILNLDIRVGESETYYLRLTEQPTAPSSDLKDRWWVMVHVDGQKYPDNQDSTNRDQYHPYGLSWMPPLGREFDLNNWDKWVGIRITAHKGEAKAGTSVLFKHEVWDHDADCPVHTIDAHQRRSGWVRVNIIAKDGTSGSTNPGNTNPGSTNPGNTNPGNTNPENTNPREH